MENLRLLFICQSVDSRDPIIGDTRERVKLFSECPELTSFDVLSVKGETDLELKNGHVFLLSRDQNNRIISLFRFYFILFKAFYQNRYHAVYLYMVPTLAILLYPLKILFRFKTATWFAHTQFNFITRVALQYASDLWFSVDRGQAQLLHSKKFLVGQGVNTDIFRPIETEKKWDLITVGRITPQKKLEKIIYALPILKNDYGMRCNLVIAGAPYEKGDVSYLEYIKNLAKELGVLNQISFPGMVKRDELPKLINQSKIFVFPVPGGIGKAAVEALACGIPILLNYEPSKEYLGPDLSSFMVVEDNPTSMAMGVSRILKLSEEEFGQLQKNIEIFVQRELSFKGLFRKITKVLIHECR